MATKNNDPKKVQHFIKRQDAYNILAKSIKHSDNYYAICTIANTLKKEVYRDVSTVSSSNIIALNENEYKAIQDLSNEQSFKVEFISR